MLWRNRNHRRHEIAILITAQTASRRLDASPTNNEVCFGDAFLDHVVVSVDEKAVKLARPYVFVSGTDSMCPTVLTGVEQYSICRDDDRGWLLVDGRNIAGCFTFEDMQRAKAEAVAAAVTTKGNG